MTSSSSSSEDFDCQLFVAHSDVSDLELVAETYPDKLPEIAAHALIRGIVLREDSMYDELYYEYDVTPDYGIILKTSLCYGLNDVLIWIRDNVELSETYKTRVSKYLSNLKDPWEVTGDNALWRSLVVPDDKDNDDDDEEKDDDGKEKEKGKDDGKGKGKEKDDDGNDEDNDSGKSAWLQLVREKMGETAQSPSEQDDGRSITALTAEGRLVIIPWSDVFSSSSDTNTSTPSTDTDTTPTPSTDTTGH